MLHNSIAFKLSAYTIELYSQTWACADTHQHTLKTHKQADSLALAQGMLHTVPPELLVVVDEGEGQVDVQGVSPVRGRCPLPGLKSDHQIHPGGWSLDLELVDKILTKDLTQELLKLIVNTDGAMRTAYRGEYEAWSITTPKTPVWLCRQN